MVKFEDERAFPVTMRDGRGESMTNLGMTLRDYFAAKVFAASIAGGYWSAQDCTSEHMAMMAYKHADNLLAERAK